MELTSCRKKDRTAERDAPGSAALYHVRSRYGKLHACGEYGPRLWRWPGLLFIVLVIVLVVVLELSGLWQPGIDYEDENEDEDD
jgi:hypothetical protein